MHLYWVCAESRVSGCFSATVVSINATNAELTSSSIAVSQATFSVLGELSVGKCGDHIPCPPLHSLPALSLSHFCWVLQTPAGASTWCRWETEVVVASLRWNREQSYTGVVYHMLGWVFAVSACILGLPSQRGRGEKH